MNVSFGKKIPIMQTQIKNLQTGNFEPATVFELDCKDAEDIEETGSLEKNSFGFANRITSNMRFKHRQFTKGIKDNNSFYILQNKSGETLGIAQTEEGIKKGHQLEYLETKYDTNYKYVGQTLLASISKDIMKKDGIRLSIFSPIPSAIKFYQDTCGFQNIGNLMLTADSKQLGAFVSQTESKTKAPLVDLKG